MRLDKKFLLLGLVISLIFLSTIAFADDLFEEITIVQNPIKIFINDNEISSDNFIYNDTTYIPLRSVGESLNNIVYWDGETNTAKIFNTSHLEPIKMTKGDFKIDGLSTKMSTEEVKKLMGEPKLIRKDSSRSTYPYSGLVCTIWEYEKYIVIFESNTVLGIVITSEKYKTARGIKIGDDFGKVLSLYGQGGYNNIHNNLYYCDEYGNNEFETNSLDFHMDKNKKVIAIELRIIGY